MGAARCCFFLAVLSPLYGAVAHYEIAPAPESHFALEITKTGLLAGKTHRFEFLHYHGALYYNAERVADSNLRLTIESKSAICRDTWVKPKDREKIQKYALNEMLDTGQYPEIVFQSTVVQQIEEGSFRVQGRLTIRDQTQPVTVTVKLEASNPQRLRFNGQAKLKLTDYRLKPPTAALGAIGTRDEMTVLFELTGKPAE